MESMATNRGLEVLQDLKNGFQGGLGNNQDLTVTGPQPFSPHLDLLDRFLPGNNHGFMTQGGQPVQDLEDQGGFSYPRITADQDSRSWNHPAAQHPVQLIDPDQVPLLPLIGNFFQRLGKRLPARSFLPGMGL